MKRIQCLLLFLLSTAACISQADDSVDLSMQVNQLIRQLDDDSFQLREEAQRKLVAIGKPALTAIRKAKTHQSAEVRSRAGAILRQIIGKEMEGTWTVIFSKGIGGDLATIKFTGSKFHFTYESGEKFEGTYEFRQLKGKHNKIDLQISGGGISYVITSVAGEMLKYCGSDDPTARPTEFASNEGDGRYYFILKRIRD